MNIRRISALTIALSLLLSLTACGGQGDSSQGSASDAAPAASDQSSGGASAAQSFSLGYYKGEGLHPYTCSNTTNQNLMGLIYEPLFAIDQTFAAEPCLDHPAPRRCDLLRWHIPVGGGCGVFPGAGQGEGEHLSGTAV